MHTVILGTRGSAFCAHHRQPTNESCTQVWFGMINAPLNDFRVHVRGNTVLPPSVDCFLQQVGDVTAQCQAPWLVGVKPQGLCFDVLAGSPEDTRSANRKSGLSFANGLYPLSAWSRNSQTVPLAREAREAAREVAINNKPTCSSSDSSLPAQESSQQQNSSGTRKYQNLP